MRVTRVLSVVSFVFVAAACGKDGHDREPLHDAGVEPDAGNAAEDGGAPDGPPDEYEAELFDHTRTLDDTALAALMHEDADLTLHFAGKPAAIADLSRGHVLLAGQSGRTPAGLLRLVTKVEAEGTGTAVHTMYAPLQLAFKKLHASGTREVGSMPVRGDLIPKSAGGAFPAMDLDFYAFNGDSDESTPDDQVHVTGHLEAGFSYFLGVDTEWGDLEGKVGEAVDCVLSLFTGCNPEELLPEVKVGFSAKAGAEASLSLDGVAFLGYEREIELADVKLEPISIGFLVFVPSIEVVATIEGEASSRFNLSASAKAGAHTELSFSSKTGGKLVPPTITEPTFEAPAVDATLSARGRVRVGPSLHLRLYDLFGPYASFYAFAELGADVSKTPCFSLEGGLEGDVGLELVIDTPVYELTLGDFKKEFGLAKETVATGSCDIPPGGIPGVDEVFADPKFTPWSSAYAHTLWGLGYSGPGSELDRTRVQQTVDGHYLVTSTSQQALLKVDESGGVVWANEYVLPESFDAGLLRYELSIEDAAPTLDAGLIATGYPYTLFKIDQEGKLAWAHTLAAPYYSTYMRFAGITATADGNFLVLGNYADDKLEFKTADSWLLKIDPEGKVLWSRRIGTAGNADIARVLLAIDNDAIIVGSEFDATASRWRPTAMRVGADGKVLWAKRYTLVEDASEENGHLVSARLTREGDILAGGVMEGVGGGEGMLVVKIKPADGALAFSSVESTKDGYLGMELTDLVELPTSGYLAVGNYERIGSDVWMAGLDSVGKIHWLRRYGQVVDPATAEAEEAMTAGLTITGDGGALVVSCSQELGSDGKEALWAMKVPAKDGAITFADGVATTSTLTHDVIAATVTAEDWAPVASDVPLVPASIDLTVRAVDTSPRAISK